MLLRSASRPCPLSLRSRATTRAFFIRPSAPTGRPSSLCVWLVRAGAGARLHTIFFILSGSWRRDLTLLASLSFDDGRVCPQRQSRRRRRRRFDPLAGILELREGHEPRCWHQIVDDGTRSCLRHTLEYVVTILAHSGCRACTATGSGSLSSLAVAD